MEKMEGIDKRDDMDKLQKCKQINPQACIPAMYSWLLSSAFRLHWMLDFPVFHLCTSPLLVLHFYCLTAMYSAVASFTTLASVMLRLSESLRAILVIMWKAAS